MRLGGPKNFFEVRLFSHAMLHVLPKMYTNFSVKNHASSWKLTSPRIFALPWNLVSCKNEALCSCNYFFWTFQTRHGQNIGGAMAPLAPPLTTSLASRQLQAINKTSVKDEWANNIHVLETIPRNETPISFKALGLKQARFDAMLSLLNLYTEDLVVAPGR